MNFKIEWDSSWEKDLTEAFKPHADKIAEEILQDMKDLCPVDTGALRDSLAIEEDEHGTYRIGSIDKDYALYEENGTSYIPPKHFMRNALYKTRE